MANYFWGGDAEPTNGRERILRAVYDVLRGGGYEALSMKQIADEAGVSKATIYHHFDDKDELLLSFLEAALSQIGERTTQLDITDPVERIRGVVDRLILGYLPPEIREHDEAGPEVVPTEEDPLSALIDVRAQALHHPEYRERVAHLDRVFEEQFARDIAEAVEDGSIREVDPERAAKTLYTVVLGGFLRRTTAGDADLESVRDDAYTLIDPALLE